MPRKNRIMRRVLSLICVVVLSSCGDKPSETSWDEAKWIWHPDVIAMATNKFTYFKKTFDFDGDAEGLKVYFAADATARLYINGEIVRRKITRYHPSKVRPEEIHLDKYLKEGTNEILILHHNWGDIKNFQRDEIRRAGMLFFAPNIPELQTDTSWQTAKAKHFTEHEQQIIGVIGDLRIRFPLIMDGRKMDDDLDWQNAVVVEDGPWTMSHDYYPKAQREEFKGIQAVIAAGAIKYPDTFSYADAALLNDVGFPAYMEKATYLADAAMAVAFTPLISGNDVSLFVKGGETAYATFDLHVPIHGYPSFEVESDKAGVAISFGYGELNYSLYDGSNHVNPDTGWIKTEGVVGPFYGDRYITSGEGLEIIEIPEERTARYLTMHISAPEDANLTFKKLGLVKSQYPVDWIGSFDAEDKIIDQIITLSKTHAEITMSDVYVDTPGREDGQWLEDIRLRALLAETWAGDTDLRYLTLSHSQESSVEGGKFLSFAPQSFVDLVNWDWGMQWITMLHDHLKWIEMTSDGGEAAKYFGSSLTTYVELLIGQVDEEGLFRTNNVFADIRVGEAVSSSEDVSVIAHTWLIKRLAQAIEIADFYGIQNADIIKWTETRERMIDAFHKNLVVQGDIPYAANVLYAENGILEGKSQAAQLSAIDAGLFSEIHSAQILDMFFSTPVGKAPDGITPWNNPTYLYRSIKALSDHGLGERAMAHFKWRMSPYLPGSSDNLTPINLQGPYGGPLPEYFVRHEDLAIEPPAINTAQPGDPTGSHGWAAVGMTWLHDSVLGVSWGRGGLNDKILSIEPHRFGLMKVKGDVISPWGKVSLDLKPDSLSLEIPDGVTSRIKLDFTGNCSEIPEAATCEVQQDFIMIKGGGRYTFKR